MWSGLYTRLAAGSKTGCEGFHVDHLVHEFPCSRHSVGNFLSFPLRCC